jgi:hypothetical protein
MTWFANLKTAYKLGIGFGGGILITLIVGITCVSRLGATTDALARIYRDEMVIGQVGELRGDILAYHRAEKNLIIETTDAEMDKQAALMDRYALAFVDGLKEIKKTCLY